MYINFTLNVINNYFSINVNYTKFTPLNKTIRSDVLIDIGLIVMYL